MADEIGTSDLTIKATGVAWTPNGSETVITNPKNKADGKNVAITSVTWLPSGCTLPSHTFVAGVGSVIAGSSKCKCSGQPVVKKGDTGICIGSFTLTATPFTPTVCTCTLEVDDAGQTIAKCV